MPITNEQIWEAARKENPGPYHLQYVFFQGASFAHDQLKSEIEELKADNERLRKLVNDNMQRAFLSTLE